MGYLNELVTATRDLKSSIPMDRLPSKPLPKRAMDGTLFFSCLMSDTIPIELGSTLCRTMERVYAAFVQGVLSMESTIDISSDRNPVEFLKKFHHNTKLYESLEIKGDDDLDTYIEGVSEGKFNAYFSRDLNCMMLFNESDSEVYALMEEYREQLKPVLESYNLDAVGRRLKSAKKKVFTEAEAHVGSSGILGELIDNQRHDIDDYRKKDSGRTPQLFDKDVKKTNDLAPYQMEVKLMAVNDKKEFVQFMNFIVGVKVTLHPIRSDEMISNVKSAVANNDFLFNMIRWTTGEKALVKDLMLHLDEVKLDVANKSRGASPEWMNLKRLRTEAKRQSAMFKKNQLIPNSTLVLSRYEVDYIRDNYGYDLTNTVFAKKLMDALFLMAFIIVDDVSHIVKVIYAGTNTGFQVYSLDVLEKEVNSSTNKLGKELVRMIAR